LSNFSVINPLIPSSISSPPYSLNAPDMIFFFFQPSVLIVAQRTMPRHIITSPFGISQNWQMYTAYSYIFHKLRGAFGVLEPYANLHGIHDRARICKLHHQISYYNTHCYIFDRGNTRDISIYYPELMLLDEKRIANS